MAVPSLNTASPNNADTDVYTNKNPVYTFNAALDSDSVTEDSVLLFDRGTNLRVPISVTYDNATFKVTIVLQGLLRENTAYRVIFVGDDLKTVRSLSGTSAGDDLTTSIIHEWTTGDDQYQIDTTVGKEIDSKTLEGELFLPSNVKALGTDFRLSKVRPQNHSNGVAPNLTGDKTIKFTFTKPLNVTGSLSDWVELETYPLLTTDYLAVSGNLRLSTTGAALAALDFSFPTGTITATGAVLTVTFDRNFPNNAGLEIQLTDSVEDEDGNDYGGGLNYSISTALYPDVVPPRTIKREVRHVAGDSLLDDYVAAMTFKNSIWLWERVGRSIGLSKYSFPATKYVFAATILDILEDQDYEKFLTAGTRRQLGDMNVSVDSLIGRLALKIASTQKDKERALETLTKGWQLTTAVKSEGAAGLLNQNRLWYDVNGRFTNPNHKFDQPDLPASNTALSRRAKTTNPWF
jgi:hypothetical protein